MGAAARAVEATRGLQYIMGRGISGAGRSWTACGRAAEVVIVAGSVGACADS